MTGVSARDHSWALNPLLQDLLHDEQLGAVYWTTEGIQTPAARCTDVGSVISPRAVGRWLRRHSVTDLLKPWSRHLRDQAIVVEHTSVNPVHPLHVGSLRGSLIGGFLVRLLRSAGASVSSRYFVNDQGRQTRLLSWILQQTDITRLPSHLRFDHAAAVLYALVNMFYASRVEDIERLQQLNPWLTDVVTLTDNGYPRLVDSIHRREQLPQTFWQHRILDAALSDLCTLGADIDHVDYESTLPKHALLPTELTRLTAVTTVNGSLCLRHRQGLVPLTRPDGSWLYFTRDVLNSCRQLAHVDRVVHVVGDDQELLQRALQSLFPSQALDYVGFGAVTNQGRKFSARQNRLLTITDVREQHGERELWQLALSMMARRRQRTIDLPQPASTDMLSFIVQARRAAEAGHGTDHRSHTSDEATWPVLSLLLRTPAVLLRSLQARSPHPVTQLLLHLSRTYLRAARKHHVTLQIQAHFLQVQSTLANMLGLPLHNLTEQSSQVGESSS